MVLTLDGFDEAEMSALRAIWTEEPAMSDIYDQHKAAFSNVSAFVVLKDGARVATVAIKFPKDGAGRLWAYVHFIGTEMVRGHANGYGYDKRTAAVSVAARKVSGIREMSPEQQALVIAFREAAQKDDGNDWTRNLEAAGFTVLQAV
jgi:hypothetical protein